MGRPLRIYDPSPGPSVFSLNVIRCFSDSYSVKVNLYLPIRGGGLSLRWFWAPVEKYVFFDILFVRKKRALYLGVPLSGPISGTLFRENSGYTFDSP